MSAMATAELQHPYRSPCIRRDTSITGLNPRTLLVARHIAGGFTEKEVGFLLGVSRTIARRERERFKEATGAITLRDIVLACRAHGLDPA